MAGRHRSDTPDGGSSAVMSTVWLLVILGLLAFGTYVVVAHRSIAYPVVIALSGTAWVIFCASLGLTLLRGWPHSPAEVVSVADKVFWLGISTSVLLNAVGSEQGFANGPVGYVLIGVSSLFLFYVVLGKRLLRAS